MASLRLWILGVALGSFATGVIVGGVVPDSNAAVSEDDYAHYITTRYELSAEQEARLRMVLQKEREERMATFLGAEPSQLPPELTSKLLLASKRTNERIRKILDARQLARYDEDCRPAGGAPDGTNR